MEAEKHKSVVIQINTNKKQKKSKQYQKRSNSQPKLTKKQKGKKKVYTALNQMAVASFEDDEQYEVQLEPLKQSPAVMVSPPIQNTKASNYAHKASISQSISEMSSKHGKPMSLVLVPVTESSLNSPPSDSSSSGSSMENLEKRKKLTQETVIINDCQNIVAEKQGWRKYKKIRSEL